MISLLHYQLCWNRVCFVQPASTEDKLDIISPLQISFGADARVTGFDVGGTVVIIFNKAQTGNCLTVSLPAKQFADLVEGLQIIPATESTANNE